MDTLSNPVRFLPSLQRLLVDPTCEPNARLKAACEQLGLALDVDSVRIDRLNAESSIVATLATWSRSGSGRPSGLPAAAEDLTDLESYTESVSGSKILESAPLLREGTLVGFVHVAQADLGDDWTEPQSRLLHQAAGMIARQMPVASTSNPSEAIPPQPKEPEVKEDRPIILVVEDDPSNAHVLRKIIERKGALVEIAESGQQAVEACKRSKYDIIMMDLRMPELDGFDATREIVTGENLNNETPIIAVTADTTEGIERRCTKLGMRHYIAKPIRASVISDIIGEFTQSALENNPRRKS